MMSFLHNYMFNYNTVGKNFQIPFQLYLICYGRRICVDEMDYYLSLPRLYFQTLLLTLVVLNHPKYTIAAIPRRQTTEFQMCML